MSAHLRGSMEQIVTAGVTFNISDPAHVPLPKWNSKDLIASLVLSFCFVVGVPGNIAVICFKPHWEHLSSLSQSLMLNLAVSDLLSLLTLPFWIYSLFRGWIFGTVSCKLLSYVIYCCVYGSQLTVTVLSIQRYIVVVRQKRLHQTERRALVLLWFVAFILSTPSLVVRELTKVEKWMYCKPLYSSDTQMVITLLTEVLLGFSSMFLVAYSYIRLHMKVKQRSFFKNPQTTRLITSIIVSLILWTPYQIINVLGIAAKCLKNETLLKFCQQTWSVAGALSFVNSCLNPLLYAFTSQKFYRSRKKQQQKVKDFQSTDISTPLESSL